MIGYPGTHGETKPTAITLWRDFVSRHLAARADVKHLVAQECRCSSVAYDVVPLRPTSCGLVPAGSDHAMAL